MRNTREQILDLAIHYIRKYGYDSFSYADISKELGITKASIHYYFKSKEDLLVDIIERFIDLQRKIEVKLSEICDNKEKLKYFFIYEDEGSKEGEKCPIVMIENIMYKMNENVKNKFHELVVMELNNLANIIEEYYREKKKKDFNSRKEAIRLLSMYKGNTTYSRILNDISPMDFILEYIEKI